VSGGRAVLAIAGNELRRVARDRVALIVGIAVPIVIMLVVGSAFGSEDDALDVGLLDRDRTPASADLVASLEDAGGLSVTTYDDPDDLRLDVRTDVVNAGLVVPRGYGDDLERGRTVPVEMLVDPTSTAAAAVSATVQGAVSDESVRLAAGRVTATHTDGPLADSLAAVDRVMPTQDAVVVHATPVGDQGRAVGAFDYTVPANMVLFVFVATIALGVGLAGDRRLGLVRRMLATPHRTGTILAGIGGAKLAFSVLQSVLLVSVGTLLFGFSWGSPVGAGLLIVLWALVATSVGLVVGTVVGDPDQARAVSSPVAIAMGMLGGCMWPLEIVPPIMRTVGHVVPHAWAMDAWSSLALDGEGVGAVTTELLVLAGFALVLGTIAVLRLRSLARHGAA
jgi:ABC-2 type transport system permease protein